MTTRYQRDRAVKSALVQAAERRLESRPNRGDYIIACVGIVGCVVFVILAAMGVV